MCLLVCSIYLLRCPSFQHGVDEPSNGAADDVTSMRKSVCDAPSTGVLLLADIAPSMVTNIFLPFFPLVKK